jgi:hypothetical protein
MATSLSLGEGTYLTQCAVFLSCSWARSCTPPRHQNFPNVPNQSSRPTLLAFHCKCSLHCSPYFGTSSIACWQPHKPEEYMSWCNNQPVGGCMIQNMAAWRYQQRLSYNIQYMGETLQEPTQKVTVQV